MSLYKKSTKAILQSLRVMRIRSLQIAWIQGIPMKFNAISHQEELNEYMYMLIHLALATSMFSVVVSLLSQLCIPDFIFRFSEQVVPQFIHLSGMDLHTFIIFTFFLTAVRNVVNQLSFNCQNSFSVFTESTVQRPASMGLE